MSEQNISLFLLFILAFYILKTVFIDGLKYGFINFTILIRVAFLFLYVISGICHLIYVNNYYRGFFDSDYYSLTNEGSLINIFACLILYVHYLFLVYFQNKLHVRKTQTLGLKLSNNNLLPLFTFGVLVAFLALLARYKLLGLMDLTEINRTRESVPGSAKFIIMSNWFAFGAFFIFYSILAKYKKLSNHVLIVIFILFAAAIVGNISWRGGRVVALLYTLPLLFLLLHYRPKIKFPLIVVSATALVLYIITITAIRKQGYDVESTPLSQVLDWEIGRYSMVAYGIEFVSKYGFTYGSTFIDAIIRIISSPIYFSGLGAEFLSSSEGTLTSLVGLDIFGTRDITFVVPGILAESYINFSLFGALLLSYIVAKLSTFLDKNLINKLNAPFEYLLFVYIGSLLLLNFYNATSTSFLNYLFFNGLPAWLGIAIITVDRRFRRAL